MYIMCMLGIVLTNQFRSKIDQLISQVPVRCPHLSGPIGLSPLRSRYDTRSRCVHVHGRHCAHQPAALTNCLYMVGIVLTNQFRSKVNELTNHRNLTFRDLLSQSRHASAQTRKGAVVTRPHASQVVVFPFPLFNRI